MYYVCFDRVVLVSVSVATEVSAEFFLLKIQGHSISTRKESSAASVVYNRQGLSLILGRWLGMVVSSINNTTTGCAPLRGKVNHFIRDQPQVVRPCGALSLPSLRSGIYFS